MIYGVDFETQLVAKQLNTYAVNIQIGDSVSEDVKNSFLMTMDAQLEVFAKKVRKVQLMCCFRIEVLVVANP